MLCKKIHQNIKRLSQFFLIENVVPKCAIGKLHRVGGSEIKISQSYVWIGSLCRVINKKEEHNDMEKYFICKTMLLVQD